MNHDQLALDVAMLPPLEFEIPDRVVPLSGNRAAVLALLGDGMWHTTAEINSAQCGGTEGTRRLRELRAQGWDITKRRCASGDQYEYRLRAAGER